LDDENECDFGMKMNNEDRQRTKTAPKKTRKRNFKKLPSSPKTNASALGRREK
jgi:hypothetical protein